MQAHSKYRNILVTAFLLVAILFSVMPAASPVLAATTCDWAQFVADVTIPDGTTVTASSAFSKTWRLKNIGTCTWSTSYTAVFVDGTQMGATTSVALPNTVAPGATVDITVPMTAPSTSGTFRANWQLKNAGGTMFGIGTTANKSYWVEIKVGTTTDTGGTGYDFVTNAGSAAWTSGAGSLTFPGTDPDAKGFVKKIDAPVLENGTTDTGAGLLTVPQDIYYGYIQGVYPAFKVQSGDKFQATVNCERNATACYVNFRLNYQIGTGAVQTLWSFNERYEGLFYKANVDLSALAGQDVKFILYVGAAGYGTGDRALWGTPKIVRGSGTVVTPVPSITPGGPTVTPNASCTDRVTFIADKNVPDGTIFPPNTPFTKTWTVKNTGTCTWTTDYSIVFVSGDKMGGPDSVKFTSTVGPNTSFDISVPLTSPTTAGSYKGNWQFKNKNGVLFGIGSSANLPWWVQISVSSSAATATPSAVISTLTPTPSAATPTRTPTVTPTVATGVVYDFVANGGTAAWSSGAGALTFTGTDGDAKGFVLKPASLKMEDGVTETRALMVTFPQNVTDGYIRAEYPGFDVKSGDKFQATIGCENAANDCYVTYRLDYKIGDGAATNLWAFTERYEGLTYNASVDLSSLAGKNVKFILTILAAGSATGDRAVWVAPRITR